MFGGTSSFLCAICFWTITHWKYTHNQYSVFVAHLLYICPRGMVVFLLCCFPPFKRNIKTTWSQTVVLIHSDSPPVLITELNLKCLSLVVKMTVSLHVLCWITFSLALPKLSMLFEACGACLRVWMCERVKGKGREGGDGREGMGARKWASCKLCE